LAAQHNLGFCYKMSLGVAKDFETAAAWYAKAAAQGDAGAQVVIGAFYEEGLAVAQDFKTAAEWYAKAAAQGAPTAVERRDACLARLGAASGL